MENLEGMCKVKLVVLATISIDKTLKYCDLQCNGYKKDCPYYSPITKKDIKNYKDIADGLKH